MPTRLIYEKICDSATLAQLTGDEERLFHRLVVKADDYGRFHAHPSLLLGACFPLLIEQIGTDDVRAWRDRLVDVGLVALYVVDGREYLQLVTWPSYQRQRGSKPKFPPPLEGAETCGELPQAADICGSRVVKTRNPEAGSRRPVAGSREPLRAGAPEAGAAAPAARSKRGSKPRTDPPETLEPNEADYARGAKLGMSPAQVDAKVASMLDYHRRQGYDSADWHASLRTWLDKAPQYDRQQPPGRASPPSQNGSSPPSTATLSRASSQRISYLKAE